MSANQARRIVVTTRMGGVGPTGVETHFNNILRQAASMGFSAQLITPYTGKRWHRALFRPLKNRRGERVELLYRRAQGWLIRAQLQSLQKTSPDYPTTLYAQCPLSAQAGLEVCSRGGPWRNFLAVHFNISEALEMAQKGVVRPNGRWPHYLSALEAEVLPRVDKIIFVSNCMKRIVNDRLPAIASVSQETIFNFPPEPTAAYSGPIRGDLITIGTLEPRKNQAFLLRVLAAAKSRGKTYSLAVVGDGPDRMALEQQVRAAQLDHQVSFHGYQADAARLIPGYRCLVHSSVFESGGITIVEALSYGRPVLAAPVGGIPEHFRNGNHGVYWDLNNPAAAAEQLIALLEDPERYAKTAAAAKAHYQQVFAPLPEHWVHTLVGG